MVLALLTTLAVIALRMILFVMDRPPEGTDFMLVHFMAIVTVVFFTGQAHLSRDIRTPFPDLLRDGFKHAAVYAVLYSAFILVYYNTVEADHFRLRVDRMVAQGMAEGQPEAVIRPRLTQFFTPFNYGTITFFALLIVGAFNAFVLGLLHHKVMRRLRLKI